jgi:hypothetical protein
LSESISTALTGDLEAITVKGRVVAIKSQLPFHSNLSRAFSKMRCNCWCLRGPWHIGYASWSRDESIGVVHNSGNEQQKEENRIDGRIVRRSDNSGTLQNWGEYYQQGSSIVYKLESKPFVTKRKRVLNQ